MRYLSAFINSVGNKWAMLPGFISGGVGVVGTLGNLGVTWLPEISWWAIAFFVLLPISLWSLPTLVVKVVRLEERLAPQLKLGDLDIVNENTRQVLRFSVANKGNGVLSQCLARLMKIDPVPEKVSESEIPAVLQTEGRRRRPDGTSRFHADAAEKYVVVALNAVDATQKTPVTVPTEHKAFKLSRDNKYMLQLVVSCDAGRPLQRDFTIFVGEDNRLGIERMAAGKYVSLEEARRLDKLEQFAKEHPSKGDAKAFGALLDAMAKGRPPKSSGEGGGT